MNIMFDSILDFIKTRMPNSIVNCKCETCNTTFLTDLFLVDYMAKSNSFNKSRLSKPDDWYIKAFEHFNANPTHTVIFKCPPIKMPEFAMLGMGEIKFMPNNLSEFWRENKKPNKI